VPLHPPPHALVVRFKLDLCKLTGVPPDRLGIAVSGGPDSLALLLLAAAALPGSVCAATVDHGLRPESAAEARFVGAMCGQLYVPHEVLAPVWEDVPASNISAEARAGRYRALSNWAGRNRIEWIATGHHIDDQAETLLMRLARGSGIAGLAGVRAINALDNEAPGKLVRPLLGWRKAELRALVDAAGLRAVDDPTNDSEALDRTHVRRLLGETPWLDAGRVAASAAHLFDAEEALLWTTERVVEARLHHVEDSVVIDPRDLPRELQRRLLLHALGAFTDARAIPGPKLITLLDTLLNGRSATLAEAKVEAGDTWRVSLAPPRRT
jgi:tRNA(Ile)-lysidine synthase